VPEDLAGRLVDGIDRALEAAEAFERATTADATTSWFEPFKPAAHYPAVMKRQVGNRRPWVRESGGVWAADSPHMLFELFDAFAAVGLIDLVTDYLGERPAIAVDKCTLRRVGADTSTDWHQDGAFLGTGTIRTLNVWVALTRCGRDAPGLDLVPTRLDRVVETGTDGAKFGWAVGPGAVERAAGVAPIRPEFDVGDVMFFDELLLHRTAVDEGMTKARYAIETWFFAPSAYPEQYVPLVV
jgi:ectoine hydroxylase-related dioxygenase (phytanoyl-CoA dioxygenase family)